jgi:hypothetical protein
MMSVAALVSLYYEINQEHRNGDRRQQGDWSRKNSEKLYIYVSLPECGIKS